MKRLLALCMIFVLVLTGCGGKSSTDTTEANNATATDTATETTTDTTNTTEEDSSGILAFTGEWKCRDAAEESDYSDYYVGYLVLEVGESGAFNLYDAEAGNPSLSGTIVYCDDMFMTLACDDVDFDPPSVWDLEDVEFDVTYTMEGTNVLKLTYDNYGSPATLIFDKY